MIIGILNRKYFLNELQLITLPYRVCRPIQYYHIGKHVYICLFLFH